VQLEHRGVTIKTSCNCV